MDADVHSPSPWSLLPGEILSRVFSFLSRKKNWKTQASSFALVNVHWYNAVRGYVTTLKPRINGPFSLSRELEAVCRLTNLKTLVIEEKHTDDTPVINTASLQPLKCLKRFKISNGKAEAVLGLLHHAPYLTHLALENLQCPLSIVWSDLMQQTSLQWLHISGPVDESAHSLESLNLTQLERLDIHQICMQPDILTSFVGSSQKLKVLRVSVDGLSPLDFETLHGLKALTSLTLEGVIQEDVFDPALLPRLKHLSFFCCQLPLGIKDVPELTSLGLETLDALENQETFNILRNVISHLDSLELSLPFCDPATISAVLAHGQSLDRLKIKNHLLTTADIRCLKRLRELDVLVTKGTTADERDELLRSISWLSNLKSVTLDLNNSSDLCELLYTENDRPMELDKLVVNDVTSCGVPPIFVSGQKVRDLRLSNWLFDASVFTEEWLWSFVRLRNLCFSNCQWKTTLQEELGQLLDWEPLKHLRHLALPTECFHPENMDLIDELRESACGVRIDDNPDWSPHDFRM